MKQYLLFDLDGTLTDPKVGITTCVQYALKSFGIEEPDLDKLEPFIGPPLTDSFMNYYGFSREQAEAAVEKYRERFRDIGIFENQLYDGIPEMLKTLYSKGMHLAVASSKPTVFVERILEHFKIAKYFKVVVGSELDGRRVNKDEVVEEALRQLFEGRPVEREKVYMIGDRCFDVEGARAQRVESVGVTYGYGSMEELKEAKADYIVRSVGELKRFLLRETEELPQGNGFRRLWTFLFPLLLFWLVRALAQSVAEILVQLASGFLPGEYFYLYGEDGLPMAYTGNTAAVISAVSFLAGAAAVWKRAVSLMEQTANDMWLTHLKSEPKRNFLLLGMLTVSAVMGLNLFLQFSGMIQISQTYQAVAAGQHSAGLALGLICYGIVSPIAEELLFRGIIYGSLRRMTKPLTAMLFSSVLFGMYHLNSVQGIYGFLMGCLMVYAYEYFGDFKAPLAVHMISNILAYSGSYLPFGMSESAGWGVCIGFLALAAGSLWLMHRQKRVFL